MSHFERTSSAIYTIGLALVFGLNKDAWSLATRPMQNFFRNVIKSDYKNPTDMKEIAVRFLGNLTLATIVTAGRIPLMSIDHIINKGIELHYLTMPLLMSFVTTSAIFTWSEHLAMIDEEATPLTKFIFRRINEVRYIVIATFAATAALLNPSQHGVTFWITIAGVGLAGATIYFKASVISEWLEKQAWLKPLKNYLTSKQLSTVIRCQNLFVL